MKKTLLSCGIYKNYEKKTGNLLDKDLFRKKESNVKDDSRLMKTNEAFFIIKPLTMRINNLSTHLAL
jgi:hypothetical protein